MDEKKMVKLALRRQREATDLLVRVVQRAGRPWAEEHLALRMQTASVALGESIKRELRRSADGR